MLTLYIDVVNEYLVANPNSTTRLNSLVIGQDENKEIAIVFLEPTGNTAAPYEVTSIPSGYTDIVVAGVAQNNLTTQLFSATTFNSQGSGSSLEYVGTLNANTPAIAAALGTAANLPAFTDVILLGTGVEDRVVKLQPTSIPANIWGGNAVLACPSPGLLNWLPQITGRTGGAAGDIDNIPTAGIFTAGYAILTAIGGEPQIFVFTAGAAGGTDIAPVDYNSSTNNFHWHQIL